MNINEYNFKLTPIVLYFGIQWSSDIPIVVHLSKSTKIEY